MRKQAEDVMGSLLKEYMSTSQKQDEIQNLSEGSDKVISTTEEKDIPIDKVEDPEGNSSHSVGNLPEPEESSSNELKNGKTASECLESNMQELGSQLQIRCTPESENLNPEMQCFKNIVAIVDPPRGGLHPTVSNTRIPRVYIY